VVGGGGGGGGDVVPEAISLSDCFPFP